MDLAEPSQLVLFLISLLVTTMVGVKLAEFAFILFIYLVLYTKKTVFLAFLENHLRDLY